MGENRQAIHGPVKVAGWGDGEKSRVPERQRAGPGGFPDPASRSIFISADDTAGVLSYRFVDHDSGRRRWAFSFRRKTDTRSVEVWRHDAALESGDASPHSIALPAFSFSAISALVSTQPSRRRTFSRANSCRSGP